MWRLYYILFVYLKSFKELGFQFWSESGCKDKWFIFTVQIFSSFFRENFSDIFPESFSRSLATLQGKILGQSGGSLPDSFIMSSLNYFPSRKRMQRYALFSFMQYFRQVFFWKNYRFILKYLLINEKSNRIFFKGVTREDMLCIMYTLF